MNKSNINLALNSKLHLNNKTIVEEESKEETSITYDV